MKKIRGLFRVVTTNDKSPIVGTAFAIKSIEFESKYYLLTAYHVISELKAKSQEIIVKDENGSFYPTKVIFPKNLSQEFRTFGQDYALLEMYSNIEYEAFDIAIIEKYEECFVRGAIPHYCTIYTRIDGKILSKEKIENQKDVLQLNLDVNIIFNEQNNFIPKQSILCGLSGAPVLVEMNGKEVCVGVLGNLERDNTGSLQYAVPMKTIVENCFELLKINIELYYSQEQNDNLAQDTIIQLLIPDEDDFLFFEEDLEQNAWNKLSNLFYKGRPVDLLLKEIIDSSLFQQYNSEVRCAILYFYARLQFKRSRNEDAFNAFQQISNLLTCVSFNTKIKLEALINARSILEKEIESLDETLKGIRYAGEKISCLSNASNEYIAYELASIYGKGLTNALAVTTDYSCQVKEDMTKIYREHSFLLNENPVKLCKQDVVNTSLQWCMGYWKINKEIDLQSLKDAVTMGFNQSRLRKNNIFYVQSMLSYGIFCAYNNEMKKALKVLILCAELMKKEGLFFYHEGIKQLLFVLKSKYELLYRAFEMAYKFKEKQRFLNKVALLQFDLGNSSWESLYRQVDYVYSLKFGSKSIYGVKLGEIESLL